MADLPLPTAWTVHRGPYTYVATYGHPRYIVEREDCPYQLVTEVKVEADTGRYHASIQVAALGFGEGDGRTLMASEFPLDVLLDRHVSRRSQKTFAAFVAEALEVLAQRRAEGDALITSIMAGEIRSSAFDIREVSA